MNHFITFNNLTLWETFTHWKMMHDQIQYPSIIPSSLMELQCSSSSPYSLL